ncbi:hypothetical protein EYC80_000039 [Monilinia laxa]|uniref:DUF614 domain protein n=1 Tax=Monilinia laxa TaxID=61186 RepID=A0A5N6K9B8_MONLA|nr:hypothetical protein EYC80_000039 [Monilinia laxa]
MATRLAAAREKRKLAKNPPVTKYNFDTTTPVHRQSLATTISVPAKIENKQPGNTPVLRYAIPDHPQRSEPSLNRNKSEHKGQSDWMVPFCYYTDDDSDTVQTGIITPCALYGKTHMRLKNVSLGRDPHDLSSSSCCNSMCWIHGALTVTCCLSVGLTVVQRARIRAQYRINGTMGDDVVKSLFCGPCAMIQHDREVRAREGDTRLAKNPDQYIPQMSQMQPKSLQPMRYPLSRATSAENPGVETKIFKKEPSAKLPNRYTDSKLQEVPAEAIPSASQLKISQLKASQSSGQHTQNCEVEALRNHMLMQKHKNAINTINTRSGIGKVDGATSSKLKTRVGSEKRDSFDSLIAPTTLYSSRSSINEPNLKVCEKQSRIPAREQLSYIHDFSDYSATKVVLDHYAEEDENLQGNGTVRRIVKSGDGSAMRLVSNDVATNSTMSSSSSTIRQQSFQKAEVGTLLSEFINQDRIDSCTTESVDSAWLLDTPTKHRISSCSIIPSDLSKSQRQYRIASCPATSGTSTAGTSVSSVAKDRMLSCTIETAPPSSSSSCVMQHDIPSCKIDMMDESGFSTPLIQYSQYGHLLEEDAPESNSLISSSKYRASSCSALGLVAAREQQFSQGRPTVSGDSSPASGKQYRVSSCCASIPSGGTPTEGYLSHTIDDCNFTDGSSTPVPVKQHRLTSCPVDSFSSSRKSSTANPDTAVYLMEDGCLLSGAASPIKQHRAVSCGEISSTSNGSLNGGNLVGIDNAFENGCISSGSQIPKPLQNRAVSCIASSIITECELENCDYDSKTSSLLQQPNTTGFDTNSLLAREQRHLLTVLEEEQEHLLEDCMTDSGPSTPLRQHGIADCITSSSSSRNSVNIPDSGIRSQGMSHGILVDASENDQSTHTNYEDCLHTLEECITPADRAKMEANASQNTEYEKYSMRTSNRFPGQSIEYNEKSGKGKGTQRSRINAIAAHESDTEFTFAQALSFEEANDLICVTQIDGDGTMSIASRSSVAPAIPFSSPAVPSTPIEPLNMTGAYPSSITPLNIRKDKKRIPSEHSSAGSGFASYFGFGNSKKPPALVIGSGGGSGGSVGNAGSMGSYRRGGNRSASRSLGVGMGEAVQVEEVELEDI